MVSYEYGPYSKALICNHIIASARTKPPAPLRRPLVLWVRRAALRDRKRPSAALKESLSGLAASGLGVGCPEA